jgi:hypothetical protein
VNPVFSGGDERQVLFFWRTRPHEEPDDQPDERENSHNDDPYDLLHRIGIAAEDLNGGVNQQGQVNEWPKSQISHIFSFLLSKPTAILTGFFSGITVGFLVSAFILIAATAGSHKIGILGRNLVDYESKPLSTIRV